MADVSTVGDSGVIQLVQTVVGPCKRRIEVIALGYHGQHPTPCGEQFPGAKNPFPWMSEIMDLKKEKNFFETRVTEYQTGGALNWD